jgi:hypothetical protein
MMPNSEQGEGERERQLDAIIAEYFRLEEKGEAPVRNEFIARYPLLQQDLREFFADFEILHQYPSKHKTICAL